MNDGDIGAQKSHALDRGAVAAALVNGREDSRMTFFDHVSARNPHAVDNDIIGVFGKRSGEGFTVVRVPAVLNLLDDLFDGGFVGIHLLRFLSRG